MKIHNLRSFLCFIFFFNLLYQRVTTSFTVTTAGPAGAPTGASYGATLTTQAFVAGDRGCQPILAAGAIIVIGAAAAGVGQLTTQQMTIGSWAASTQTGLLNDLWALQTNLCNVNGGCCYSNYCNPATKTVFNPVNLALALVFSLISYVAIF